MKISIHKSVGGNGVLTWSVRFNLDDLPANEEEEINDHQLGSLVIVNDGRRDITLDKLVKDHFIAFRSANFDKVIEFENRAKEGLKRIEINAEQRAAFFNSKPEPFHVRIRKAEARAASV